MMLNDTSGGAHTITPIEPADQRALTGRSAECNDLASAKTRTPMSNRKSAQFFTSSLLSHFLLFHFNQNKQLTRLCLTEKSYRHVDWHYFSKLA